MKPISRAWLQIHFCVLLWGFTAILGKLITLPALQLVSWRMTLVTAALLLMPRVWRGIAQIPAKLRWTYIGIGVLITLHWVAFYGAIKLSNASVAVTCIATGPVFLSLIEPFITGRRFVARELWLGAAAIPAVALVVGGTPANMRLGLIAGIIAAALVALFAALNKRYIEQTDAATVTAIEIGTGAVLLGIAGPWVLGRAMFELPSTRDLVLLALLAYACTLLPFMLSLVALRRVTAFGAQLVTNLEPVYAIVLAIPILGEQRELNAQFYVGVAAILTIVFAYPLLKPPPQP